MTVRFETRTSREDEKHLYTKYQFKGTCNKCGTYIHKSINCKEIKEKSTVHSERNMDSWFNNFTSRTGKTSTVITARKMVTQLNNVTSRISTRNNVGTVTGRVAKKRTYGGKKKMTMKNKKKMWFKTQSMTRLFWRWCTCMQKRKKSTSKQIKSSFQTQDPCYTWWSALIILQIYYK